jgi:hypothetical protein
MNLPKNVPLDIRVLAKDLRAGHRAALARTITLMAAGGPRTMTTARHDRQG